VELSEPFGTESAHSPSPKPLLLSTSRAGAEVTAMEQEVKTGQSSAGTPAIPDDEGDDRRVNDTVISFAVPRVLARRIRQQAQSSNQRVSVFMRGLVEREFTDPNIG
jgi:hypothetical protein